MIIIVIKIDIRMVLESENRSRKLQIISGKLQNKAINDVKQISQSHVMPVLHDPILKCFLCS